ncbi:FecR family protein [Pedobacter sp. UBA4863]|uniref:FecR family protein n=1 Tax=Pedobacter sp. UBA4863 TaxID=1947060 RepID=UPI0025D13AD1|nr:FecR family protein [Pedobacter sp. UBA4863]
METSPELHQAFENYLSGKPSEQDLLMIQEHFKRDVTNEQLMQLIRGELESVAEEQNSDAIERVVGRTDGFIRNFVEEKAKQMHQPFRVGLKGIALMVASVIAVVVAIMYYQLQSSHDMVRVEVPLGEKREITLPDNSKMWVNAGSRVSYPKAFADNQRIVTVEEGQIYFDVVHEKHRSFIVKMKDATVNVLGTAFEVKAYANETASSVTVFSGKVGVIPANKGKTVFLLPSQKVNLEEEQVTSTSKVARATDIAAWKDDRIAFEAEEFATIIRAIERQYNVTIKVERPELNKEKITLRLEGQSLSSIMEALSFSNHFTYQTANEREITIK